MRQWMQSDCGVRVVCVKHMVRSSMINPGRDRAELPASASCPRSHSYFTSCSLTAMAHRWCLPKVAKWEVRSGAWDLGAPDMLDDFLATFGTQNSWHRTAVAAWQVRQLTPHGHYSTAIIDPVSFAGGSLGLTCAIHVLHAHCKAAAAN